MTLANGCKQLTRLLLLLVLPCMPCLAEQSDKATETPSFVTVIEGEAKESKATQVENGRSIHPRLKYRNGPVCMCNSGLSEAEIRAAWIKRFVQAKE